MERLEMFLRMMDTKLFDQVSSWYSSIFFLYFSSYIEREDWRNMQEFKAFIG